MSVNVLKNAELILIDEDAIVHLTENGRNTVKSIHDFRFNGFNYRGNEILFFERLSLVVQTLSNFRVGKKSFLPIQKNLEIQQFVKRILMRQPISEPEFSRNIMIEIQQSIDRSGMKDIQKSILTHRLGGFEITGWTWSQLAEQLHITPTSVYLYFIESLHLLLDVIETSTDFVFLSKITENIKVTSYLTDSSKQTSFYLAEGLSIEEISKIRNLKMSTIEDHFVEIAANDPNFSIEQFVTKTDIEAVIVKVNELRTKRLKILKEEFNSLTFFQLRLILSSQSEEVSKWT